jgi:5-formyltetrahydrofolate cyclo-ligase
MRDKKQGLRVDALLRRESLPVTESHLWSRIIQERVVRLSPYLLSHSVALYHPIGREVATEAIREHSLSEGKKLFYPRLNGDEMDLVRVRSAEELKSGCYGILEPVGDQLLTEADQDRLVVFVPGIAFDRQGNRLGRGRGYYDRVLARLHGRARFVALAYEFQIVEELPIESWDQKVHHIVTERRTIDCGVVPSWSDGAS